MVMYTTNGIISDSSARCKAVRTNWAPAQNPDWLKDEFDDSDWDTALVSWKRVTNYLITDVPYIGTTWICMCKRICKCLK